MLVLPCLVRAQAHPAPAAPPAAGPIAIVSIEPGNPGDAATVTGALEVTAGKAIIATSGTITSGKRTTYVTLPRRGTLRICAATTVKLAADTSIPSGGSPGLLMAIDHGAVEMSFAASNEREQSADVLLTPDFRIYIGGPGASEVKVRLGSEGDTCVDNSGADAPYVVVTSLFDSGLYRVQPGQRVMLQHGSLREVVDNEKEPCGCPPAPSSTPSNEFPLAQSEGLAPLSAPAPAPAHPAAGTAQTVPPLVYSSSPHLPEAAAPVSSLKPPSAVSASQSPEASSRHEKKKRPGIFRRLGHFFRKLFGAES
ncbi:MAG: hypothetical protein ACLGSH_19215 [Acidobacteriota bacterium]